MGRLAAREVRGPCLQGCKSAFIQRNDTPASRSSLRPANRDLLIQEINLLPAKRLDLALSHAGMQGDCHER